MDLTRDLILERVALVNDLPSFPEVVLRLEQALSDPEASARRLALIVEEDPALSARFLRVANSAFYGARGAAVSVQQAVVRLGIAESRRLALATAVVGRFGRVGGPDPRRFWVHALVVALSTRVILRLMRSPLPREEADAAFAAGLLHDLGAMVLFHVFPERYRALVESVGASAGDVASVERALWHIDHGEVGDRVARRWKLPDAICTVVRYHHEPDAAPEPLRRLVAVVRLANGLADATGFTRAEGIETCPPPDDAWRALGIGPELAADLLAEVGEEAIRSSTFLELAS